MMIEIKNLTKKYGEQTVLSIEQLSLNAGETVGIVGNNGAGKTTLLSCMLDLIQPTSGSVSMMGKNVALSDDWKSFTNSFLDSSFLINYLSPEEYYDFIAKINHYDPDEVHAYLKNFERLFNGEVLGTKKLIRDLSKGNMNKTGIVGALLGEPRIVILDEPFSNLDPSTQITLKEILKKQVSEKEMLAVISSHDLNHIVEISDRIILLEKGRVVKNISTSNTTLEDLYEYFKGQIAD